MGPGDANTRGMRGPRTTAENPPKGSRASDARWRSCSSLFRTTGSCARAAREVIVAASMPASSSPYTVVARCACATCAASACISAASRAAGGRVSSASKWSAMAATSGQPALAALVALDVPEALALAAADAEVELLDVFVGREVGRRAVHHDAAALQDVAVVGVLQGHVGVLLGQQE